MVAVLRQAQTAQSAKATKAATLAALAAPVVAAAAAVQARQVQTAQTQTVVMVASVFPMPLPGPLFSMRVAAVVGTRQALAATVAAHPQEPQRTTVLTDSAAVEVPDLAQRQSRLAMVATAS